MRLYTSGIADAQYINPVFAIMLIIASMLYSFRSPYNYIVIAAGRFKETRIAAYGEALINLTLSIVLVIRFGLVGVAVGTVVATLFRFIYFVIYLSKNVLYRSISVWAKRIIINLSLFFFNIYLGGNVLSRLSVSNYLEWAIAGIIISILSGSITFIVVFAFYRNDVKVILQKGLRGKSKKKNEVAG